MQSSAHKTGFCEMVDQEWKRIKPDIAECTFLKIVPEKNS